MFNKRPPPPPPPPTFDVVPLLVALVVILGVTLLLLVRLRKPKATESPVSNGGQPKKKEAATEYPRGPLVILWGSQTGTAEGFGNDLMREARKRGWDAKSVDLEEYTGDDLAAESAPVVFLLATHGEGEPTDNTQEFYRWANDSLRDDEAKGGDGLFNVRYAVFALGNTQYEQFCYMGKWAQKRLEELGATPLCALGEGDDDVDIVADFEAWCAKLWPALGDDASAEDVDVAFSPSFDCVWPSSAHPTYQAAAGASALAWLGKAFPKLSLFECDVAAARELTHDPSADSGSVKHIELACAARSASATAGGAAGAPHGKRLLRYAGADDLGVCCDNGEALAAKTAELLSLSPQSVFELRPTASAAGVAPPLPTPCTVAHALRYHCDLRAPVSKPMLKLLAASAGDAEEASTLARLGSADGADEYASYIVREGRGLTEVLREFRSSSPPFGSLLELVAKLAPRYYTISSSPLVATDSVHLTVKVLREPMSGAHEAGRLKEGVCSTQLGDLTVGSTAIVFVRPSAFRLPKDPATPVVMIGPGTGVAPFRAFVQQLSAEAAAPGGAKRTGAVRLYFGCRRSHVDYLYREELAAAEASGALSALRTAFSREKGLPKVYVQDRLKEDASEVYALMASGGHVYVCGATAMGRDVVALLTQLYVSQGGLGEEAAAAAVKRMSAEGRLVQELWS